MDFSLTLDVDANIKDIIYDESTFSALKFSKFFNSVKGKEVTYLLSKEFWSSLSALKSKELSLLFYRYTSHYFFSQQELDGVENQKILCRCVSYLEKSFFEFLKENPSVKESEISGLIQVGAGCGSCLGDVHKIFTSVRSEEITAFELVIELNRFLVQSNFNHLKIISTNKKTVYLEGQASPEVLRQISAWFLDHPNFDFIISP